MSVGNHVLLSDEEKHTVYKLNVEEHNKELFVGKEDTAGFDDGITKEARITSPCGICNRGMVLYISEHPENKQGGVRFYSSLSGGLISFKSAWRDIVLCFGNISKRKRLHYIFIISQLWLTSHPRGTMVLLDTGTPGASREIYSEDADGETRTRNPSVINSR